MKNTPLHTLHLQFGARMGEFGGWDMPIQYAGILQEHEQTRTNASVFDICHMGEFELSGETALLDLEKLLTCNIQTLDIGQVRYGFMLNSDGGTIDDLTCYRMDLDRFMLVVNAGTAEKDAEWIKKNISPSTTFTDLSPEIAKLDVQGPKSREVVENILGSKLSDLGYFRFQTLENGWIISRTGYTGEWGYEIYLPNNAASALWDDLTAHDLCEPGGLGARDTLRLEMGYSLYGHELSEARTPAVTSCGMFINMKKDFICKENVAADLDEPEYLLVGLKFNSKRAAREHDKIYFEEIEIGEITSGSVAPSLGHAVAMAFIEPEFSEIGRIVYVEIRNKKFPAEVVNLPFYKDGTARG
ncbi:MAG: glycine cleavage system aminomethyltransferase GcvT [Kiritimatiellaceae bacterium]|nr:glycine cleavage system aminomethyltransferase GcvT [Kiritimatiellaceae bacterium]